MLEPGEPLWELPVEPLWKLPRKPLWKLPRKPLWKGRPVCQTAWTPSTGCTPT
jgi:hypothetical protein